MKPSRAMISGEITTSLFALGYAWSGGLSWPFEHGPLFNLIAHREGWVGNLTWLFLLGAPALGLILVDSIEWFCSSCWTMAKMDQSATLRARLVATQFFSWLYMLHLLMLVHNMSRIPVLAAHAVVGAIMCFWAYWENRRVRREIRYATSGFAIAAG
jgi:hypothetical protein